MAVIQPEEPQTYPLVLKQGSDEAVSVVLADFAENFTGATAEGSVIAAYGEAELLALTVAVSAAGAGGCTLSISADAAASAALTISDAQNLVRIGVYDIKITLSGGDIVRPLAGDFYLVRQVTA